ncbi:unnamed protein product [Cylindrotheca closterium]|uniref:Uncharacterized protein n=1 Tax=Cylindrotheca closterium TaxID=2856 RepID=A0AAD2FJN4_9STRA|nr:unnamed protein product [Cylindrotheca closterium]
MLRQTIIVNEGDSPLAYKAREVTNPVMQYVSSFNNNFERKRKVEVWNGASGKNVEPLLRSIQSFRNISSEWGLNQGRQKKALFKQFLTAEPHMTYQRISDAHGNSVQDFEDSVDEFICEYTGENPKYQANMYLFDTSNHIRKPYNTEIGIHANRLKTLFMYHDMLPGNCSNVNDENDPGQIRKRKLALFRSFPIDWQGDFINSRNDPANDDNITWKDIVSWMTQKKRTVDRKRLMQESSPRRTRPGNRTGGRGLHHNRFRGGRGHGRPSNGYQPYPRPSSSPRYSQGTSQSFQRGGNSQQQNQGRFQPRHPNNGGRGRGFNGQRGGRSQSGRFQPGRNYQGRGQSHQQNSQNFYAESHYNQEAEGFAVECSVPEWNQDGMSYGGMPSAEQYQHQEQYYQAEENQQWNDQYNYEQEEYYPEEQEAHEHFSYDEDSPFSFHEEHY